MPEPPTEYTEAINALKAFRSKVLQDLVGARILAGIDANHDSMVKFSGIIDDLSVTPYMFGKVKEKALALKLGENDVEGGGFRKIVANYTGTLTEYPLNAPFNVPQRPLPKVDVYLYEMINDLELLKETDMAKIKSFLLIQCASDTFEEEPDAENAFYDYYYMLPQRTNRGEWTLTDVIEQLPQWEKVTGEYTLLRRTLTPHGTTGNAIYYIGIFLEPIIVMSNAIVENPPVIAWHPDWGLPTTPVTLSVAGRRIPSTVTGVYSVPKTVGQSFMLGFMSVAGDLALVSSEVSWLNEWVLTMAVEPAGGGTVTPTIGTHKYQAETSAECQAFPNAGYLFHHWDKNGVNKGSANPISVVMDKDVTMKAVFALG